MWGLLRLYLLCDNSDVQYFCCVREDTALALFEFYKYRNVLFSKGNVDYHK